MANQEQLEILKQGVKVWNEWRENNRDAKIDFREVKLIRANLERVNLKGADLSFADLRGANLCKAFLEEANFMEADLSEADLREANLIGTTLIGTDLSGAELKGASLWEADLRGANLTRANLYEADLMDADLRETILTNADLTGADLRGVTLVGTSVDGAKVSESAIYGINVWDLDGEFKEQDDLILSDEGDPLITVDSIKVAQFINLIMKNEEIRDVINTLTSKSVLILGRFSIPERKAILDSIRNRLREYNLLPIVFDFDRPTDKDFTETIKTLAGLSYFVIADITNPKSSPLELQATVPDYQIPFVPIIQEGESPFAMMVDLQKKYNWVLNTVSYDSEETLMKVLKPLIIDPAMKKRNELRIIKAQVPDIISGKDFLVKGIE